MTTWHLPAARQAFQLNSINTNSRKLSKEERCWSKDDAWVDILIHSHSCRTSNQDTEPRRPPGGPRPHNIDRQDPEMASLEVVRVLASVRGPSPSPHFYSHEIVAWTLY